MRSALLPIVTLVVIVSGCYRAHQAEPAGSARPARVDAGRSRTDAGPARVDAGPVAMCDESKLRTAGLAEPWAPGSACEHLIVCLSSDDARSELLERFPDQYCRDGLDAVCVGVGPTSCGAFVGTLSAAQYDAACELTLHPEIFALFCAGDL